MEVPKYTGQPAITYDQDGHVIGIWHGDKFSPGPTVALSLAPAAMQELVAPVVDAESAATDIADVSLSEQNETMNQPDIPE